MKTYTTPYLKFRLKGAASQMAGLSDKVVVTFEGPEGDEIDKVWDYKTGNDQDNICLLGEPNQNGDNIVEYIVIKLSQTDTAILGPGTSKIEITFNIGNDYFKTENDLTVSFTEAVKDSEVK